jgi:hypothetical protein
MDDSQIVNDPPKPQPQRKPQIGAGGARTPITELKLRSLDDREWALSLTNTHSREDAIIEIKNRLGIDLKWETTYSRFIRWQEQKHRLQDYLESIQQRRDLGNVAKTNPSASRSGYTAQLMDEAMMKRAKKTLSQGGVARPHICLDIFFPPAITSLSSPKKIEPNHENQIPYSLCSVCLGWKRFPNRGAKYHSHLPGAYY